MKDILFLLTPGFYDNDRREFCPECAELWGVLSYYPALKEGLDIRPQELSRPREGLVALLGAAHQNCPTLVLGKDVDVGPFAKVKEANGNRFIDNARDIAKYFAHRFGTAFPRGSQALERVK